jgi:phosphatidylglycerophosphatase A
MSADPLSTPAGAAASGAAVGPVAVPGSPVLDSMAEPAFLPAAVPAAPTAAAPRRPGWRFLLAHPAHAIALGFGSGLSPWAPGTVGTLWGWLAFLVLDPFLSPAGWGLMIAAALLLGWWACARTAQHLGVADPGSIVWDEIVAIWLVLWLVMPAGLWGQLGAVMLFRYFDAAKPGPVGWADRLCKLQRGQAIGWRQGFGILFDDAVAALCTLLVISFVHVGVQRWWTS